MIGRALLRFPLRARLLHPTFSHAQHNAAARLPVVALALRSYATPGRPKKDVGEPSRPVKRAVKKAAAKPNTGDSPAEGLVKEKKRIAAKKPKKAIKNVLTPEEKAAKKEKQKALAARKKEITKASAEKQKLKDLREQALKAPKLPRASAYLIYVSEERKKSDKVQAGQQLLDTTREIAAQWKSLSPAEIEHYNHLAVQEKQKLVAEYKRWVESHTPDEIKIANRARARLRRLETESNKQSQAPRKHSAKWPLIRDERAVKRPVTAYMQFSINRNASGDFKNIATSERSKLIGAEWKALSEDEKKKYSNIYETDRDRYVHEYKDAYGSMPHFLNGNAQPEAVAAAA